MTPAGCTSVFYHYVRDVERTAFPGIRALSVAGLAAQLDWLEARFGVIDGATFERAVLTGVGFDRPTALLTFDDGFTDHYEHVFPLLRGRGLGGIFFVAGATLGSHPALLNVHKTHFLLSHLGAERFATDVAAALEREGVPVPAPHAGDREGVYRYDEAPDVRIKRILNYEAPYAVAHRVLSTLFERHIGESGAFARQLYLSPAQVREMAQGGMTFGFHTETHPVLSRLDLEAQRAELRDGPRLIGELTGQRTVSFCYPYGFSHTYNADTLNVLEECGYSMAFNTVRRETMFGQERRYELPRFDTRDLALQGSVEPVEQDPLNRLNSLNPLNLRKHA
ncbi:MAG: polysaccharide deacetylase family protein [Acidobacteria bacterium]|nr:polysaccharide deacetylase family protein [Acidobacteriota bacterium]